MTASQVLMAAAERITKMGWCQGSYGRLATGSVALKVTAGIPCGVGRGQDVAETCIVGALRVSGHPDDAVDKAKEKLRAHLGVENLADWNDAEGRTVGEVIDALNAAAK